jgi:hypothetical protein
MRRGIRKIKQLFHLEIFDFFSSPVRDRDEEERQMGRQRRGSAALEIALPPWRSLCRPGNRSAALEIAGDRSAALEIALPPRRSLCRPGDRSAALEIALPPWSWGAGGGAKSVRWGLEDVRIAGGKERGQRKKEKSEKGS